MAKRAYRPTKTRTFTLVGHRSSGKTSLSEVLFQTAGVTRSVGRVDERSSLLDDDPSERRRGMTLGLGFAWMEWDDHLLNLVDTPGSEGLSHDRTLALHGVDGAVVVVSGPDGVEFGTERVLAEATELGVPHMVVVNKMDRLGRSDAVIEELQSATQARVLPIQLPFFEDDTFVGVISLLERRVYRYDPWGTGRYSPEPVPERYQAAVDSAWERVVETVALCDDQLLERYLEFLELPREEVLVGLSRAVALGELVPVLYASAARGIGAHQVLDAIRDLIPSPERRVAAVARNVEGDEERIHPEGAFVAQLLATRLDQDGNPYHVVRVWSGIPPRGGLWVNARTGETSSVRKLYQVRGPRRTIAATVGAGAILATWNRLDGRPGATFCAHDRKVMPAPAASTSMMSFLLTPLTRRDEDALPAALSELTRLDASLELRTDELTGGVVIAGQGQMHLEHVLERLRERLGVKVDATLPPVGYRETPIGSVRGVQGIHRRQSGDEVSEFGECWIDVSAAPPQDGVRVVNAAAEEQLPNRFLPSINEGIQDGIQHGPMAGYPVVGMSIRCVGGEYDMLFSTDEHFRLASARAVRSALEKSGTELLEPWCAVEVEAAADEVGGVLAELSSRRGRILGMEVEGRRCHIRALAPERELRTFAPRLQSITGGRGRFRAHKSHYEKLPRSLVKEAIDQSPYRQPRRRLAHHTPHTVERREWRGSTG